MDAGRFDPSPLARWLQNVIQDHLFVIPANAGIQLWR